MKKIFILHLFFTHCILNASEKSNGIIFKIKEYIMPTDNDITTATEWARRTSPEIKLICNCATATCALAACYHCPQPCCSIVSIVACIECQHHSPSPISNQPKKS